MGDGTILGHPWIWAVLSTPTQTPGPVDCNSGTPPWECSSWKVTSEGGLETFLVSGARGSLGEEGCAFDSSVLALKGSGGASGRQVSC